MTDQRADGELDALIASSRVVLVVGPGGVGKTTLAAAIGCRAARLHDRRVLAVTVDPARRLADALGVAEVPADPVLVPVAEGPGRLWALMVDMARSWDELVTRLATPEDSAALLANPLYRSLTTRFIQSHDYIALDHLCELSADDRYDLVVIDTPPSGHAIDVLDAPDRMIEFFDSRLLRWLTAPYRSRLAQVTARPFLALAERLLGGPFLATIAEFFWLFSRLQPGFAARAAEVKRRLDDPSTGYVLATTSEPAAAAQAESLLDALEARNYQLSLVVHNRVAPTDGLEPASVASAVDDPSLRAAMTSLAGRDERFVETLLALRSSPVDVVTVPWRTSGLTSVAELAALFD